MNILFTCAGRRHYLLGYFKDLKDVKVTACDTSICAPALYNAHEFFIVPEVIDKEYIKTLLKEAISRGINAIVPLNDFELPIMAENKEKFMNYGINIIVSSPEVINYCYDKYISSFFFEKISISRVPTFLNVEEALDYHKLHPESKFIIKPRWGTASLGIEFPFDDEELRIRFNWLKKRTRNSFPDLKCYSDHENCVIIQKKIEGSEYGLDIVNNLEGKYQATLIRKKLAMRSGETDKAETMMDERLLKLGERIGNNLGHIGMLDCDILIDSGEIYLIDMNPRFGGGYPFIHHAGANVPYAFVKWLRGETVLNTTFTYKGGMYLAKTDIIVETSKGK